MTVLRTPEHRFDNLPGYRFAAHYVSVPFEGTELRLHYVDEGPRSGPVVLLLHGQPSWSYLYRKVIPVLAEAGCRVVAPDLIGFGKSDKPADIADFSYARQEQWLRTALFDGLGLRDVTLYAQDWGGLLGLRIVAFHPEYFARVMIANTGLPPGGKDSNFVPGDEPRRLLTLLGTRTWQLYSRYAPFFSVGPMCQRLASETELTPAEVAAYEAPFPTRAHMAGPRAMPSLIPTREDDPAGQRNRQAWRRLGEFTKPFRTAYSDLDPTSRMMPDLDRRIQRHVPGAAAQRHPVIEGAGHFLQEDQPDRVAEELLAFIHETTPEAAH